MVVSSRSQLFMLESTLLKGNVYGKKLKDINNIFNGPWTILGDFNSIMTTEEKKGGIPHVISKTIDFINCMDDCGMTDLRFTRNPFTWCNGRKRRKRINKRLNRVMINEEWA